MYSIKDQIPCAGIEIWVTTTKHREPRKAIWHIGKPDLNYINEENHCNSAFPFWDIIFWEYEDKSLHLLYPKVVMLGARERDGQSILDSIKGEKINKSMSLKFSNYPWVFWFKISIRKNVFGKFLWKTRGSNFIEIQMLIFRITIGRPWLKCVEDNYKSIKQLNHLADTNFDNLQSCFSLPMGSYAKYYKQLENAKK